MVNNDKLLMRFKKAMLAPTGKRELSSTSDVDAGLGNALLSALEDIEVTDTRPWSKPLVEFLSRKKSDQLKFGEFDDVEAFLRAYRAAGAGRRFNPNRPEVNTNSLPVLNLGRTPGFQLHDNTIVTDEYDAGYITDKDGKPTALLSHTPIEISYSLMVLANEKEVLNALTGIYASWFRQFSNFGNTNFIFQTVIAGAALQLNCLIRDPKAVIVDNLTLPLASNRVFASAISFTVIAPLYSAWKGTPLSQTIDVLSGNDSGVMPESGRVTNGR